MPSNHLISLINPFHSDPDTNTEQYPGNNSGQDSNNYVNSVRKDNPQHFITKKIINYQINPIANMILNNTAIIIIVNVMVESI